MSEQAWMAEPYDLNSLDSNKPYCRLFDAMRTHADGLLRLSEAYSDALQDPGNHVEATLVEGLENQEAFRSRASILQSAADDITRDCHWLSERSPEEMAIDRQCIQDWNYSVDHSLKELEEAAQTGLRDPEHLFAQRSALIHARDAGLMLPLVARHRQSSAQQGMRVVADNFIASHHGPDGASQLSIPVPSSPWERRAEARRLARTFENLPTSVRESKDGQIVESLLSATWVDPDSMQSVQNALLESIRSAAPRRPGQTKFGDRQSRSDNPQIAWRRRAMAYHKATKPTRTLIEQVKSRGFPPFVDNLWPANSDASLQEISKRSATSETACATRSQSGRKQTIEKLCKDSIRDHNKWLQRERNRCSTSPETVNALLKTARALQKLRQGNADDTLELLGQVESQLSEAAPDTVISRYIEADTPTTQSAKRDNYNAVGWHCDCAVSEDGRSMKCGIDKHTPESTEIHGGSRDQTELKSEGDVLTFVRDVLQEALKEEEYTAGRGRKHCRDDSGVGTV